MNERNLYDTLANATSVGAVEQALAQWKATHPSSEEVPVGRRPNNRGAIEVAADAGRSLIERVTNAHDAVLELEHNVHKGIPMCRSPREAAEAWLGVPATKGLAGLTVKQRQDLALSAIVRLEAGEGSQSRLLSVIDRGVGIAPDRMQDTILSLNESNKIQKHYLAGTYGQGGSSTFAFSKFVFIASRAAGSENIAFTVVRYEDLPAAEYKTGRYVYLTTNGTVFCIAAGKDDLEMGTVVRHFGFDLSKYNAPLGPKSLYGVLQRVMFDPVAPVRLENRVSKYNRVIKGARNALNGAVDVDDDTKGPDLDYNLPMFNIPLGDHGDVAIEYWVLKNKTDENGKIIGGSPSDVFVDSKKPIVLTHNGQNQGEVSAILISRDAGLPFLRNRLICHINCDRLSPAAKRQLFSSTREQSREGFVLTRIEQEIAILLKSDDELKRLNEEAKDQSLKERDESAEKQMRRQVAKLLHLAGATPAEAGSGAAKGTGHASFTPRKPRPKPEPIAVSEPPTYIRIVADDEPITFYAGQRRYIRVETDANSDYHDASDPKKSRINVAVGQDLKVIGTSPLSGGRMRIGIECANTVVAKSQGSIRVELYRAGLSALGDEKAYEVVDAPKPKDRSQAGVFPDFKVIPVGCPDDPQWSLVNADSGSTDVAAHASGAMMDNGVLLIYYSEVFPRYSTERKKLELRSPALAASFTKRYELWVAVHALLVQQASDDAVSAKQDGDDDSAMEISRQERCRLATIAALVAAQEVRTGLLTEESEDST